MGEAEVEFGVVFEPGDEVVGGFGVFLDKVVEELLSCEAGAEGGVDFGLFPD